MNLTDVAKLLTLASGFDRRQVDDVTIAAWHAIPEVAAGSFLDAQTVLIEHHRNSHDYFTVTHLAAGLRQIGRSARADVEADVRSARARGIVAADHPLDEPLTPDEVALLASAREATRAELEAAAPVAEVTS